MEKSPKSETISVGRMLTKSDFTKHEECPIYLWLTRRRPDLLPPDSTELQKLFATGREVDAEARKLFPGGEEVLAFNETGWEISRQMMERGVDILYQPTAVTSEGLSAKADILIRNKEGGWDLYEVKQSNYVKEEYLADVAFQRIAFEDAGVVIGKTFVIHLNRDYVREGELDPHKLFLIKDITAEVKKVLPDVRLHIGDAMNLVDGIGNVEELLIHKCKNPDKCDYLEFYVHGFPEIYSFAERISETHLKALLKRGILDPDKLDQTLLDKAGFVREIPFKEVSASGIERELSKLRYPLYFLDYETYTHPIPPFDGTRPHQMIPFQYSLDVQEEKGGPVIHREFLAERFGNPVPDLLRQLHKEIGDTGTVIAWSMGFEKTRNKEMAEMYPEYEEFLKDINKRMFDLMPIFKFKNKIYTQTEFGKSASLKVVLPVLCPELAYDDLAIQEGLTASASWGTLTDKNVPEETRQKLKEDMLAYCARDTYAMVAILAHLYTHI